MQAVKTISAAVALGLFVVLGVAAARGATLARASSGETLKGRASASGSGKAFPFTICGDQFCRDDSPVFLHILDYQPLVPGQHVKDPCQNW